MTAWTPWEIIRHQVTVCGHVLDENDEPVAGAQVTLTAVPETFSRRLQGVTSAAGADWKDLQERLDRTCSRADGSFYFLDLPAGHYTLRGVAGHAHAPAEKRVTVTWDRDGKAELAVADLKLRQLEG